MGERHRKPCLTIRDDPCRVPRKAQGWAPRPLGRGMRRAGNREEEGRWQKEAGQGAAEQGRSQGGTAWGGGSWETSEDSWARARSWRDFVP